MSEASEKKKKGGARAGCGRKKREAPVQVIDGRTIHGKDYAQQLIDELNGIDPQVMVDRHISVSEAIEIPENATADEREKLEEYEARRQVLIDRKRSAEKKFHKLSFEVQGWALLWFSDRTALETRKYLYDKAKGKAVVTVNHLHDKPIELNVNHSMSEIVRKVRLRKEEYARRA